MQPSSPLQRARPSTRRSLPVSVLLFSSHSRSPVPSLSLPLVFAPALADRDLSSLELLSGSIDITAPASCCALL